MTQLLAKLRDWLSRKDPVTEVRFDDSGFTVYSGNRARQIAHWSAVLEVFAYKQDCFTFDDIWIGFRFNEAGDYWRVMEDWIGYKEFVEQLPARFPGIRTDWFDEVARPAFAYNRTTLWGESWDPKTDMKPSPTRRSM